MDGYGKLREIETVPTDLFKDWEVLMYGDFHSKNGGNELSITGKQSQWILKVK